MSIEIAQRLQRIRPSATVSITARAERLREQGRDIVVLSVDQHAAVMSELESMTKQAQPGTHTRDSVGDPDLDPGTLQEEAREAGDTAARDLEPIEPSAG